MKFWMLSGCLLLAATHSLPTRAAKAEELPLTQHFYQVEVLLFERPGVTDQNTREELILHLKRHYPAELLAFKTDDAQLREIYRLSPQALAQLSMPGVESQIESLQGLETGQVPGQPDVQSPVDQLSPAQPQEAPQDPESLARQAIHDWEQTQLDESFTLMSPAQGKLRSVANRLARSESYRLVDHLLWVQPVPPRDQPARILLQRGERKGDLWAFEGFLSITLGRYLHVNTTLWYHPLEDPASEWQFPISAKGAVSNPPEARQQPLPGFMQLQENRRLRSKTLHYIDHPKFGLLVQIDAVEPPQELVNQWQMLQENTQQ